MRNYDKPLTLVLVGDGVSDVRNSEALLDDFIFGNSNDPVDVKLIVPFDGVMQPSLDKAIGVLKQWGVDGKDFLPVVEPNCGHKHIASAETTTAVSQGIAVSEAIHMLKGAGENGHDIVFISIFDPESTKDMAAIADAKEAGVPTLNMALGLVDTFPGYESFADRAAREEKQAAFDAEQKEKAVNEKPPRKAAAKKTAAKKATAPRKAAASQALVAEDVPLTAEPEKPAQAVSQGWGPHEHLYIWADDNNGHSGSFCACGEEEPEKALTGTDRLVAQAVAREAEKKAARVHKDYCDLPHTHGGDCRINRSITVAEKKAAKLELSGTIVAGKSELPKDLEPAKAVAPTVDVWQDIAKAAVPGETLTVRKADIVELGDAMEQMATGFTAALNVYKRMVTGE